MTRERKIPIAKVHGAAALFAFITRDAKEIAAYFNVKDSTIKKWAKTPYWTQALDLFGYTGSRNFEKAKTRDPQRDAGETYDIAKAAYMRAVFDGIPPHQRASHVAKAVGITPRRVRNWAKRFKWESEAGDWASENEK